MRTSLTPKLRQLRQMEPMFEPDCKLDSTTNDRGSSEDEDAEGRQRERARESSAKAKIRESKCISNTFSVYSPVPMLRKDSVGMTAHGRSVATTYK